MKIEREDLLFNSDGLAYRIAITLDENTKEHSDHVWANINARLANEPATKDRNWWISGVGYSWIFFFVTIDGLGDKDFTAKTDALRARAKEYLS